MLKGSIQEKDFYTLQPICIKYRSTQVHKTKVIKEEIDRNTISVGD